MAAAANAGRWTKKAVTHEQTWRLEGLTLASFTGAALGDWLRSPPFHACGFEWQLSLAPNGGEEKYKGNVGVYCKLLTPNATTQPSVDFVVGTEHHSLSSGEDVYSTRPVHREAADATASWGFGRLLSHEKLSANLKTYLPGGVLTVKVTLRLDALEERANPIALPAPSLGVDFGALLTSGEDTDVTLVCDGERLAAHALVLRARSPVLAAQLSDGPLRADADAVPVPPEITPATLRRLLHFLYTDELEPESAEEASHLLNAADHFDVPRLFAICERTLHHALSADNAAMTLTLADQHSATGLKHAALLFVAENAVAVMAAPGWTHLASARPALMPEVIHTMATGKPPAAPAAEGAAGDDAARRVRRRTR
jgi:speckle-type POZ protein